MSKHYPFRTFRNLPRSPIRFDADRPADFFNKEIAKVSKMGEMSVTYQACQYYVSDLPSMKLREG